jgi:hypothetical protein
MKERIQSRKSLKNRVHCNSLANQNKEEQYVENFSKAMKLNREKCPWV